MCYALRDELLDCLVPGTADQRVREILTVEIWNTAFNAGNAFLEDLDKASSRADFAVFVCDPIGRGNRGAVAFEITSANILFEYGLFFGRLGSKRCFLVTLADRPVYLPSDAEGHSRLPPIHDLPPRTNHLELKAALHGTAALIAKRVAEERVHHGKLLFQRLSTFTQVIEKGLDDLYERREDAREPILDRIAASERSLELYARVYISELIKQGKRLAEAILAAVVRGTVAGVTDPYEIRLVSVDPEDSRTVARLWRIEDPNDASLRWKGGPEEYREKHLLAAVPSHYDSLWNSLHKQIEERQRRRGVLGRKIRVSRAYFQDYLTPYSVVMIDREVLWVGLYTFTRLFGSDKNYGTFTPTMKLIDLEPGKTSWFDRFVEEVRRVEKNEVGPETLIQEFDV